MIDRSERRLPRVVVLFPLVLLAVMMGLLLGFLRDNFVMLRDILYGFARSGVVSACVPVHHG